MDSPIRLEATPSERAVYERYAHAARALEPALCCAVPYDAKLLEVIPREVLERDYGCGDPTRYVKPGEAVLDLGSGSGKVCFLLSQIVGSTGRVIGVDCNAEMLALSRKHQPEVAARIGHANVEFRRGLIQDLQLDLDRLEAEMRADPVQDAEGWLRLRDRETRLRREYPLIASGSIDVIVSNCVLNLVRREDRLQLFAEMFRVLRPGGRASISDIVADQPVPAALQDDPELFSGCLSGAFRELEFLQAFVDAGFRDVLIAQWQPQPWQTVAGIEFRSMTVVAHKPTLPEAVERRHEVLYRGPFQRVTIDAGQTFVRGERTLVGEDTLQSIRTGALAGQFLATALTTEQPAKCC
jgi:arsenite methyltransferase